MSMSSELGLSGLMTSLTQRRFLRNLAVKGPLYLLLLAVALLAVLPLYWMFLTSILPLSEVYSTSTTWLPTRIDLSAFVKVLSSESLPFFRLLLNSLVVSISVTILQVATSSLAAYSFARLRYPGRDTLFVIYLATLMIPVQVTMIPSYLILKWLGWIDTYQGLIVPMAFSPFGVFLLRQYFRTLPLELEDAARIDGASFLQIYLLVIMPLAGPAITALSIFTFLGQWNDFLWPLIVTNRIEMLTLSVGLHYYKGLQMGPQWPEMMALSMLASLPVLIFFLLQQRRFVQGIALTGLTGR
jgi:multiple sugar transport system permease protein